MADPDDDQESQEIAAGMQQEAVQAANYGDLQTAQDYATGANQILDNNLSPDDAQQVMVDTNQGGGPDQDAWNPAKDPASPGDDVGGDQ